MAALCACRNMPVQACSLSAISSWRDAGAPRNGSAEPERAAFPRQTGGKRRFASARALR
jgi:hypothetical protein